VWGNSLARLVQFTLLLTLEDRRRRRHIAEKGQILKFAVQYETKVKGRWYPVVRYDTAHGYAHKHIFYPNGQQRKSRMQIANYNLALKVAEDDVRRHWPRYKANYLKEVE
jgi:hypothetical protein